MKVVKNQYDDLIASPKEIIKFKLLH